METSTFRKDYRDNEIGQNYSGIGHFLFTTIACLSVVFVCIYFIENANWKEWLVIPITFLYANFAEYIGHKGPLHHRKEKLKKVFKRHTLEHHVFFTEKEMKCDSTRDFKMILFPPVLLIFFLLGFAIPVAAVLFWIWSTNAALLFLATALAYFLNYEWLHLSYHLPEEHFISKLPIIQSLRKLHQTHHNPKLMTKYNFNISYPIFDKIFGTYFMEK